MSRRFILDADEQSGQFSTFEYDAGEDMFLLKQGQKLDAILEANREQRNADHGRHGDGLGHKVASIPLHIYFDLRRQGIVQDPKAFKRWLNDPDNVAFRTSDDTV
jgi:hypothetical protein